MKLGTFQVMDLWGFVEFVVGLEVVSLIGW